MQRREKATFDILKKIDFEKQKRGWSEYQLSVNSGLTQSTISTWNKRKLQPSVASIEKICTGLGISLSEFFNESTEAVHLTEEQKSLLGLWLKLKPVQRKAVISMLKSFVENQNDG